jgi:hypothetical protein
MPVYERLRAERWLKRLFSGCHSVNQSFETKLKAERRGKEVL